MDIGLSMDIMLAYLLNNLTTYLLPLSLFDFFPVLFFNDSLKETVKVPM